MLNWQGRRWRKGGTFLILLNAAVFDIRAQFERAHIGLIVAAVLWSVVGVLFLLLVRWWWQDARKEKAAERALIEKLHEEGRELIASQMSTGKRVWRWVVNGYAIFLVAAGLYALVRYLVVK
ncbi:MAG TPA: hypothetical protein VJQ50_07500 [Terriglobales bacterium]|nr:hypothetical protein [Terriglobales bacterium]